MKHRESLPVIQSIDEALTLDVKALPPNLRYGFFGRDDTFLVIIVKGLNLHQVECLVKVLKRFKRAIGYTITNIIWIPLVFVNTKSN